MTLISEHPVNGANHRIIINYNSMQRASCFQIKMRRTALKFTESNRRLPEINQELVYKKKIVVLSIMCDADVSGNFLYEET